MFLPAVWAAASVLPVLRVWGVGFRLMWKYIRRCKRVDYILILGLGFRCLRGVGEVLSLSVAELGLGFRGRL